VVFIAALRRLGGFLWYNAYPGNVFYGKDTGSLGTIGG